MTTELAPLFAVFAPLNAQIAVADARIPLCQYEQGRSACDVYTKPSSWVSPVFAPGVDERGLTPTFICERRNQARAARHLSLARQLQRLVRHHGSGISKSRQIFRAKNSLISRWRGMTDVRRAVGLM